LTGRPLAGTGPAGARRPSVGAFRSLEEGTAGQIDPSHGVDLQHHYRKLLAHLHLFFQVAASLAGAEEAILAGKQLDEGSQAGHPGDLAGEDVAHSQFACQTFDASPSGIYLGLVAASDGHRPLVVHVN
jgi:hypothetical protein